MLRETMSDTQQYCLKWNNYTDNVLSAFELLRDQEEFVDVTLSCEGSQVKAHKVVLSACSAYFQKILKENPCQHPIIILKDVPVADLASLVHFMYHGQVMVEQERIPRLLSTAQLLQVRGLCDVRSVHNLNGTASESVMNALQAATVTNPLLPVTQPKQIITTVKRGVKVPAPRPIPMLQSIIASEQIKQTIPGATVFGSQIVTSVPLLALAQAAATAAPIADVVGRAGSDTPSEDAEDAEKRPAAKKRKKTYEAYPPPTPASTTTNADDTEVDDVEKDVDTDSDAALVIKEEPDVNFNDDDTSKKGYESDSENDGESGNEGSLSGNERQSIIPLLPKQLFSKGMLSAAAKLQAVANQAKGITRTPTVDSKLGIITPITSGDISNDDQPRKLAFHEPRPCSICGRMYRDAATLRTHTAIMHAEGKEAFVCSCGEMFKTKYEMYMHKKNGHRSGV